MGTGGMADMGAMEMPMPDNTLPMMTGFGQYGPLEMGGMFTVIKVRDGLGANDYGDPGPYTHPEGTVAREVSMAEGASIPRSVGADHYPGCRRELGRAASGT
jgi:manganese oxidase